MIMRVRHASFQLVTTAVIAVALVVTMNGPAESAEAGSSWTCDAKYYTADAHYTSSAPGISNLHLCKPLSGRQSAKASVTNDSDSVWYFVATGGTGDFVAFPRNFQLERAGRNVDEANFNLQFHRYALSQGRSEKFLLPGETLDMTNWNVTTALADAGLTASYTVQRIIQERMESIPGEEVVDLFTAGSPARKALWSCSEATLNAAHDAIELHDSSQLMPMYKLINQAFTDQDCATDWTEWRADERAEKGSIGKFPPKIPKLTAHPDASAEPVASHLKSWLSKVLTYCAEHCRK